MGTPPVLEMRDVSMCFDERPLFEGFNLRLDRDEILGLTGPSGSGKSTVLRIAVDLVSPTTGTVLCHGVPVTEYDPRELRRRMILVPQRASMFSGTVRDNLLWGLRVHGLSATEDELVGALDNVFLGREFLDKVAGNLSGGEMQRVAIARGLLLKPDALLLDEPTSALDHEATLVVEDTIRAVLEERHIGVLIVTHNREQARRFTSRVVELNNNNRKDSEDSSSMGVSQ